MFQVPVLFAFVPFASPVILGVIAVVIFVFMFLSKSRSGFSLSTYYVIKEWRVSRQPDTEGNFVKIVGRQEGLISFIATLFGIDPTITMKADSKNFSLISRTFFGFTTRHIPLKQVSETQCGFRYPWLGPIILCLLGLFSLFGSLYASANGGGVAVGFIFFLVGIAFIVAGVFIYIYNRFLLVGVGTTGGTGLAFAQFRPSFIEGQRIDMQAAEQVGELIRLLVDTKNNDSRPVTPP
ncbi:MAG: hypothetical protein LBN39_06735 [Planctomycetaceae bacterium]|jgi:hypothetical protein|nr:hypothetical protein [Planctomycetaceae bacterium]